ncbi:MAG: succinate dehydrogenase assembly factor 2 [Pseudomonas sp.]
MTEENIELKRLQWECRRGMLELDVLLKPFLDEVYSQLDAEDQARFRNLLTCEDPDLFSWFMGYSAPAEEHQRMVRMIVDRVQPA